MNLMRTPKGAHSLKAAKFLLAFWVNSFLVDQGEPIASCAMIKTLIITRGVQSAMQVYLSTQGDCIHELLLDWILFLVLKSAVFLWAT